jgi:hypothetical protein
MSNLNLGIFDNLAGYLTAAITECPGGVQNCQAADKVCNKYFLQKYYPSKNLTNARNEDVTAAFTNSIAKLGQKLRQLDISVGSVPSLSKLLQDEAGKLITNASVTSTDATLGKLATGLNVALLQGTRADGGSTGLENMKLNSTFQTDLMTAFETVITTAPLSMDEKANAKLCLTADASSKSPKTLTKCTKLDLDVAIPSIKLAMSGTAGSVADKDGSIQSVREEVKKTVLSWITAWISANYDVTALTVTGTADESKKVLSALHSGNISFEEKKLFDEFFLIMKNVAGSWQKCSSSEIDPAKLGDFRLNLQMVEINIGSATPTKLPTIVKYLPVLEKGTRVRYNDGNKVITSADGLTLRQLFSNAYTDNKAAIEALLPGFDFNSPTDLQPDLELLMRGIILQSTTPTAHVSDADTEQIAEVLKKTWQRIGANTWRHTLDDGSVVTLKPDTPEFNEELAREVSNCASVGFTNDAVQCAAFLKNVALENHEQLAQVALKMTDDVAAETVRNLHPKFALAILKAFGFHRKVCKDKVAGRQLEKMQRESEWIDKFVDKKFKDVDTVKKIKENVKLRNFLDLLAQLINANPSILNDGLVVETEEGNGEIIVPKDLALRKIAPAQSKKSGKPVLGWGEIQSNMNKVYGSFSKGLTFDGMSTNSPFGMDNLFPQMSMLTGANVVRGSTFGSMMGGGDEVKVFMQDHQTGLEYSRNVQKIIGELVENLQRNSNKTLSDAEVSSIGKKLKDFEMLERDLFETAWNIQKYSQLLKIVEVENRPEIISVSHVEKYVSKYNHLLNRYDKTGSSFNTLISLLKDCCEGGEESGENCKTL